MGLYLTSQTLLRPGDVAVTGETTWAGASMNIRQTGATVQTIPVDDYGLDVNALATL